MLSYGVISIKLSKNFGQSLYVISFTHEPSRNQNIACLTRLETRQTSFISGVREQHDGIRKLYRKLLTENFNSVLRKSNNQGAAFIFFEFLGNGVSYLLVTKVQTPLQGRRGVGGKCNLVENQRVLQRNGTAMENKHLPSCFLVQLIWAKAKRKMSRVPI